MIDPHPLEMKGDQHMESCLNVVFEVISTDFGAVRKQGYHIKPNTTYHDDRTRIGITDPSSNRWQKMVDSFYDLDDAYLCKGDDGKMYAVDYYYSDGKMYSSDYYCDHFPIIWQEVEKD